LDTQTTEPPESDEKTSPGQPSRPQTSSPPTSSNPAPQNKGKDSPPSPAKPEPQKKDKDSSLSQTKEEKKYAKVVEDAVKLLAGYPETWVYDDRFDGKHVIPELNKAWNVGGVCHQTVGNGETAWRDTFSTYRRLEWITVITDLLKAENSEYADFEQYVYNKSDPSTYTLKYIDGKERFVSGDINGIHISNSEGDNIQSYDLSSVADFIVKTMKIHYIYLPEGRWGTMLTDGAGGDYYDKKGGDGLFLYEITKWGPTSQRNNVDSDGNSMFNPSRISVAFLPFGIHVALHTTCEGEIIEFEKFCSGPGLGSHMCDRNVGSDKRSNEEYLESILAHR